MIRLPNLLSKLKKLLRMNRVSDESFDLRWLLDRLSATFVVT